MNCIVNQRAGQRSAQRGATLLVSMIFLVIITLMVVSAVKVSTLNTKMVGNMQTEQEAAAAAQQAIEETISSNFTQLPVAGTTLVDINNSGKAIYTVSTAVPVCTGVKPIKLSELDVSNTDDQPCYTSGAAANTGIVGGGAGGNSLCSASQWDLSATAASPNGTGSSPTTHQGVAVRVTVGADC